MIQPVRASKVGYAALCGHARAAEKDHAAAVRYDFAKFFVHSERSRKHIPTNIVPQSHIVKYEFSDFLRQSSNLPFKLRKPRRFTFRFWHVFHNRPKRIRRRAQFVSRDVSDNRRLTRRQRRHSRRFRNALALPRRILRRSRKIAALHHLQLTACPTAGGFNGLARTVVVRANALEQRQDVFGAVRRPQCL
jgi:hypothetical protein